MFPSQMVCIKIVEQSSGQLCPFFPRKWYALKLLNPQVAQFLHVSHDNGTSYTVSNNEVAHFLHVFLANGTSYNCRTIKWATLSMFPSQMSCLKIVEPSSGPLFKCFPRKWYVLKLSNPQVSHIVNVSIANVTP